MKPDQTAWESFLETGKIDDYLEYCQTRKQEMFAAAGGDLQANATDNRWYRAQGLQDR